MSSDQTQRIEKLQGESELTRYVGQKDNPAFQNSWVNFGGTREDAGFYKDKFNRVWLSGSIKNGTVPATIVTLPAGYRPENLLNYSSIDGTGTPSARLTIDSTGQLAIQAGNNAEVGLDGISWRV